MGRGRSTRHCLVDLLHRGALAVVTGAVVGVVGMLSEAGELQVEDNLRFEVLNTAVAVTCAVTFSDAQLCLIPSHWSSCVHCLLLFFRFSIGVGACV